MSTKLNENQNRFCEEYVVNNYNGSKSYQIAYGQEDKKIAAVAACKMLRDIRIINKIKEVEGDYRIIGHKLGVDKKLILNKLKDLLSAKKQVFYNGAHVADVEDFGASNKAIETLLKIMGDFAPEKREVTVDDVSEVDVSKLSKEERKEYKETLLRSL